MQHLPNNSVVKPWIYPDLPRYRVHADIATYKSKNYLILVNAHSKWPEAIGISSTPIPFNNMNFNECLALKAYLQSLCQTTDHSL